MTTLRPVIPYTLALPALLAACVLAGCETTTPDLEPDVVVVQGFLYADEPVRDIRLTTTSPVASTEEDGTPLTGVPVWLVQNTETNLFRLTPQPGTAGTYQYAGDDLAVKAGDVFFLAVDLDGQFITAATYIPDVPQAVTLSADRLVVTPATNTDDPAFTVTWDNPNGELHWVSIRNTATVSIPIRTEAVGTAAAPIRGEFTTDVFSQFTAGQFTHYGTHEVEVFRISEHYQALSQYVQRPIQRIYEPATNVQNGVGIFAGFNRVRYTIIVQPQ